MSTDAWRLLCWYDWLSLFRLPLSDGPCSTILGMTGQVIWTINFSHASLISGWLWTMMLLTSDRPPPPLGKKQRGLIIIIIRFFYCCPVSVYLHVCKRRVWPTFVCCCFFFPWQAWASSICSFSVGIMHLCLWISHILFFSTFRFAQRRYNVKWGISAASRNCLFWKATVRMQEKESLHGHPAEA